MSVQTESVNCVVISETSEAVLVELSDGRKEWIPRSVIEFGHLIEQGDTWISVARWFFEQKELECDEIR